MKRHAAPLRVTALLMVAFFSLASCFFYHGYPKQWAPKEKSAKKDCWQILGTYSDEGETAGKKPQTISLSQIIFARGYQAAGVLQALKEASEVKIAKVSDDTMEISVWNGGNELYAQNFSRGHKGFSCSSKGIKIPQSIPSGNGEGYSLNFPWGHLNLAVNKDLSLVVERVENAAGVAFFIIPYIGGGSSWARFKRLDTPGH